MFVAQVGETIGYGAVATALVTALYYMIRDRRDSDRRVDKAVDRLIKIEQDRAERAERSKQAAYDERDRLRKQRDDERADYEERLNILRVQLELCIEREKARDVHD